MQKLMTGLRATKNIGPTSRLCHATEWSGCWHYMKCKKSSGAKSSTRASSEKSMKVPKPGKPMKRSSSICRKPSARRRWFRLHVKTCERQPGSPGPSKPRPKAPASRFEVQHGKTEARPSSVWLLADAYFGPGNWNNFDLAFHGFQTHKSET